MLQAYIDDSGTDLTDSEFVLAGFLSSVEEWALFSDEWRLALDRAGIAYFKMSEAFARSGQFADRGKWSLDAIDRLVTDLVKIIGEHAIARLSFRISQADYKIIQGTWPKRQLTRAKAKRFHARLDSPYFYCLYRLLKMLVSAMYDLHRVKNWQQQVDVFFDDQQPFGVDALAWYSLFKLAVPRADQYLGSPPTQRDDKVFLPLQAADLYAGQLHRNLVGHPQRLWIPKPDALKLIEDLPRIEGRWIRRHLQALRHLIDTVGL